MSRAHGGDATCPERVVERFWVTLHQGEEWNPCSALVVWSNHSEPHRLEARQRKEEQCQRQGASKRGRCQGEILHRRLTRLTKNPASSWNAGWGAERAICECRYTWTSVRSASWMPRSMHDGQDRCVEAALWVGDWHQRPDQLKIGL